jgi:ABC-type uncharacterized transport system substrate-binding protein
MRRREFITLVGGAAVAWPLPLSAQQPKTPTIGFLSANAASAQTQWTAAFVQRLRELDWTEGRTVSIEYRWADGRSERYTEIATEFVRLKVDLILTAGNEAAIAVKQATSVIPIVFAWRETRSALAWSQVWRDRAVTSPACRFSLLILQASDSNFCARLSPVSVAWPSLPISTAQTQ